MDIDFPLVLVVLTFATGLIWLLDVVFLRKRRLAVAEGASGEVEAEEEGISDSPQETEQPLQREVEPQHGM